MKVMNITNIDKFFRTVSECDGRVEMISNDGTRMNLKSDTEKIASLARIFSDGKISELTLEVQNRRDVGKFIEFMMAG